VFRQFMAFADSLLDKLDVWNGKLRLEEIEIIDPAGCAGSCAARGQLLVGAHRQPRSVPRAGRIGEQVTMNVLVHTATPSSSTACWARPAPPTCA
jgi:predicted LPLAT superfamily acyltransferase